MLGKKLFIAIIIATLFFISSCGGGDSNSPTDTIIDSGNSNTDPLNTQVPAGSGNTSSASTDNCVLSNTPLDYLTDNIDSSDTSTATSNTTGSISPNTNTGTQASTPPPRTTAPVNTLRTTTPARTAAPVNTTARTTTPTPARTPVPTPTVTPFSPPNNLTYFTYGNPAVPKAAYQARTVYISSNDSFPNSLTLTTLQGLLCNTGSDQILIQSRGWRIYLPYIRDTYKATVSERNDGNQTWNTWRLVDRFKDKISGYVLCDNTQGSASQNIAVSIAKQLNAIVVTQSNENQATSRGLNRLADTRSMTDSQFKSHSWFSNIRKDIAFQQTPGLFTMLTDYAAMSGSYINFYDGTNQAAHKTMYNFLTPGAIVYGWNGRLGEYGTINSYSEMNVSMIPSDHAPNLSTLSGFRLESIKQKTKAVSSSPPSSNKHTVTLVMSDGDNLQWFLHDYAESQNHFGSNLRGTFDMGWGIPPTAIDNAAPMLNYFYDKMTPNDNFIATLSGLGYTFPSKWNNSSAMEQMAAQMNDYMKRTDLKILNILDDFGSGANGTSKFNNAGTTYAPFTKQDGIDAILYIDFGNYRQFQGRIVWSNNKPIISARYRLWNNQSDGSINIIANNIKNASKDPKNVNSYSFIIVHAWSGLNSSGNLVEHGNTMNAVKSLVDQLRTDPNIDIVTPAEFVNRIVKNRPA